MSERSREHRHEGEHERGQERGHGGGQAGAAPAVVAVPFGRGATVALAQAIDEAKRAGDDVFAPVTVVVPSNVAGVSARWLIGAGEVGRGAGLLNVTFTTALQLAARLGAGRVGAVPLTRAALLAAVRAELALDHGGFFAAVAGHRATEQAIAAIYDELSRAHDATLAALARASSERTRAVVELVRAVRRRLRDRVDERDVAHAAMAEVRGAAEPPPVGTIITYLLPELAPALCDLLLGLAERVPLRAIVGLTGVAEVDAAPLQLAHTLTGAGSAAAVGSPPPLSRIVTAIDSDDEVRCVIREAMALADAGTPLNRIGILYTATDPYARIVREQLAAAGIPHNGPGVRRLTDTVAGRALQALLALDRERYSRDSVIDFVSTAPVVVAGRDAPATAWDRLSREAGVVGGPADWQRKLDAFALRLGQRVDELVEDDASPGRVAGVDRRIALTASLRAFVDELVATLSAARAADNWNDLAAAAERMLHRYLRHRRDWPADELEAFDRVCDVIGRLAGLDTVQPGPTFDEFADTVESELDLEPVHVGRFGEGISFGPTAAAAGLDLEAVFVVGVAEGLCPQSRRDDPLLPDQERRVAAAGELATRRRRVLDEQRGLLAALHAGRTWRVACFPRGDGRNGRTRQPSRWLVELAPACVGRRVTSDALARIVHEGVRHYASFVDGLVSSPAPVSLADRDLATLLHHAQCGLDVRTHHLGAVPALARGFELATARASSDFTRFDGNVTHRGIGAIGADGAVLSPSRLETWATCPMRYFLGDVLRLSQIDRPEEVLTISPLDRGSLVHAVLEEFVRDLMARGVEVPDGADYERIVPIALTVMHEYEARGITGRSVMWRIAQRDILGELATFIEQDHQLRIEGARPVAVEMSFGLDGQPPATLEFGDGRPIRFRGRIDRVDRYGDRAIVYDYKTGRPTTHDFSADPVAAGRFLQLPIYAQAVRERLGVDEVDAYYWFTRERNALAGSPFDGAARARLAQVVTTIVAGIEGGSFPAYPGPWNQYFATHDTCRYCDFDRLCPRDRGAHWEGKRQAPALAAFAALAAGDDDTEGEP